MDVESHTLNLTCLKPQIFRWPWEKKKKINLLEFFQLGSGGSTFILTFGRTAFNTDCKASFRPVVEAFS